MKRIYRFLILVALIAGFLILAKTFALADDTNCQPIYGGGQTCVNKGKIQLNKKVQKPGTDQFVENLSRDNDPRFAPNQSVSFQLFVTNTGEQTLGQVEVKDTFPQFVNFTSGPGDFDNNTKTLTFLVFNLNPNETRTFTIVGTTVDTNNLPGNQGITCVVNRAEAVSDNNTSSDNATLCIEKVLPTPAPSVTKGGLPVVTTPKITTTPPTGPEMLPLIGLIPAGIGGLFLRRKADK
ncbi:hypothetical protein M1349_03540 [Patescibacteria group bacterium]|nr:hypothetical protein [Patescibacteria group bacterium]